MPRYLFECYEEDGGCGELFEIECSMGEIVGLKPNCPICQHSIAVNRNFNGDIYVFDSSPRTVGGLADRNASRKSSDEKEHLNRKHKSRQPYTGSLPEGGSLLPTDSKGNKIAPSTYKRKI